MTTFQKWLLHVSLALIVLSGVAVAVMKYLLVSDDPYSAAGHPLQPWALSLHVLAGPLAVFAVGWIFREHIAGRKRQRNGRSTMGSGLFATALLAPMVASGYFLQVVTQETLRQVLVVVHLVSGGLYATFYGVHIIRAYRRAGVAAALFVVLGASTTSSASSTCEGVERAREVMGSLARVVICEPLDEAAAAESARAALDVFDRVDRVMSLYKPESDVSRLNREGHRGPVVLDPELIALLAISRELTRETGGTFDVTIKPLMDHYGFYHELGVAAPAGGLAGALALVGSEDLIVDSATSSAELRRVGMGIDLGGIAKGFALDRAADVLRRRGVRKAFLDLGRELMFVGPGPASEGRWRAAVADPRDPDGVETCVEVPEGALSTSSLSGRTVRAEGNARGSVGHILDPAHGAIPGRVIQATVWSPSATRADALSTALLLLDAGAARKVLARLGEAALLYRPSPGSRSHGRRTTLGPLRLSACRD
jgi:thiamine biosynthesis lipoprotein